MNKRIPQRSHHKKVSQLDLICSLVSPGLREWSPAENKTTSLGRWNGPLPQPVGTSLAADSLGLLVAELRHHQWFVAVAPNTQGTALECYFVLRVGAANCPNPRWWKLSSADPISSSVQLHWATSRKPTP
jgi:hypothetical protein